MFTLFGTGSTPAIKGANAIAVMEKIKLGGVEQWVAIRGQDMSNPLLLWVHGGPGGAMDTAVLRRYAPGLEAHYTVVTWNQRGAVKSFSPDLPAESMTIAQFLSDLHELVAMLTRRFNQRKVYLAAHSVGTIFGLLFAKAHPDLVHAYIGVNQVIERAEEERISYRWTLEQARQAGNQKAVKELEAAGLPEYGLYRSVDDLLKHRNWVTAFGGVSLTPKKAIAWHLTNLTSPETAIRDLPKIPKGLSFSMTHLWPSLNECRFLEQVRELQVPVYLICGAQDRITNLALQQQWLRQLQAPRKELIIFEMAAHLAFWEQPAHFEAALIQIAREGAR